MSEGTNHLMESREELRPIMQSLDGIVASALRGAEKGTSSSCPQAPQRTRAKPRGRRRRHPWRDDRRDDTLPMPSASGVDVDGCCGGGQPWSRAGIGLQRGPR